MPVDAHTEVDLVRLWSLVLDESYTIPILDADGVGRDVPEMAAAQLALVDDANLRSTQAYYLKEHSDQLYPPASGGVKATGTALVARVGSTEGAVDLVAGTQVEARIVDSTGVERSNGFFELVNGLPFADGQRGPLTANVRAVVEGYSGNVTEGEVSRFAELGDADVPITVQDTTTLVVTSPGSVYAFDRFNAGMVGRFVTFPNSSSAGMYPRRIVSFDGTGLGAVTVTPALPAGEVGTLQTVHVAEFGELFQVDSSSAMTGGVSALLDAIGNDRGVHRQRGESDEQYRERVCNLADVVSPNAVCRIATRILGNSGCPFRIVETRGPGFFGLVYTATVGGVAVPDNAYKFWDAEGDAGVLSGATWAPFSRYFAILVGSCTLDFVGFAYDSTSGPTVNAYDEAVYDAGDPAFGALLASLHAQVEEAKAGGVHWEILADPSQTTQQCIA